MPPIPEMRCTSAHVCLCVKPSLSNFVVWRLSACGMSHMFVPYTGPSLPSAQRGCPCALVKLFYARLGGFPLSNKKLKIGYSSSPCNKGFTEFAPPELGMPKGSAPSGSVGPPPSRAPLSAVFEPLFLGHRGRPGEPQATGPPFHPPTACTNLFAGTARPPTYNELMRCSSSCPSALPERSLFFVFCCKRFSFFRQGYGEGV